MQRQAVVYVPHGQSVDGTFARRCWTHCLSRGYEFVALLRDWRMAEQMLKSGQANIVVMPTVDHSTPSAPDFLGDDCETVRLADTGWRYGQTRDLQHWRRPAPNSKFTETGVRKLRPDQVREILDGNRDVVGLDPESIAAARRIARYLNGA